MYKRQRLDRGEDLPQYIKDHPIYYAGPAKTPQGMACGSMGPTTAGRMDPYVDLFQSHGGSMIMPVSYTHLRADAAGVRKLIMICCVFTLIKELFQ